MEKVASNPVTSVAVMVFSALNFVNFLLILGPLGGGGLTNLENKHCVDIRAGCESVRGFDRIPCTMGNPEIANEHRRRRARLVPRLDHRVAYARCGRCDFEVPWSQRKHLAQMHVCTGI